MNAVNGDNVNKGKSLLKDKLNEAIASEKFTLVENPHVEKYPELNRKVTEEEYEEVVDYAIGLGIENGFIQEGETAEESFIPAFTNEGV